MAKRKIILVGLVMITLAVVSPGLWLLAHSRDCSPSFLWGRRTMQPQIVIETLIRQSGGLPKSSVELLRGWRLPASTVVYPVHNWTVEDVRIGNTASLWQSITDDDPNYFLQAEFDVQYADGSEARLRWRSWRYGLVFCPVVLGYGNGPPGSIEIISP